MPHEIAYRKNKIGFNTPIAEWMRGPLKSYFTDIINSNSFKTCELIDPPVVAESIRRTIESADNSYGSGVKAWTLLAPYLWEQAMIKRDRVKEVSHSVSGAPSSSSDVAANHHACHEQ